jgi:predicted unusual protein kinase regulating ubiquinone biosynthesis (AarF/ABC1/UbiB family)
MELELSTVIGELFALARKHKIRPMPETTLVLLGMVTNEGMAKRLDPDANVLLELARYLGPQAPIEPPRRRLARGSMPPTSLAAVTTTRGRERHRSRVSARTSEGRAARTRTLAPRRRCATLST